MRIVSVELFSLLIWLKSIILNGNLKWFTEKMEAIREIILSEKITKLLACTVRNTIDSAIEKLFWVDSDQTVEIQPYYVGAISFAARNPKSLKISIMFRLFKQNKCKQIPIIFILFWTRSQHSLWYCGEDTSKTYAHSLCGCELFESDKNRTFEQKVRQNTLRVKFSIVLHNQRRHRFKSQLKSRVDCFRSCL